jgi:hypothetical protein
MSSQLLPATAELRAAVADQLSVVGGRERDCFDDGHRLFLRAVLPIARKLLPGDSVQGGVAVMVLGDEVRVHPYTFREVCRNGAIMARTLHTQIVHRVPAYSSDEVVEGVVVELREAVGACAAPEAFSLAFGQMRSAAETEADLALHLMPLVARMPKRLAAKLLDDVLGRFEDGHDRSVFGLMNAVTSVARDEPDPETRWRLEELGGGIPALVAPAATPGGVAADPATVA